MPQYFNFRIGGVTGLRRIPARGPQARNPGSQFLAAFWAPHQVLEARVLRPAPGIPAKALRPACSEPGNGNDNQDGSGKPEDDPELGAEGVALNPNKK